MPSVFISYAKADADLAEQLSAQLQSIGATVFFDRLSLVSGDDFSEQTNRAIRSSDYIVVILSRNSTRSTWVQRELQAALESSGDRKIMPILRDEAATENLVWPLIADRTAIRGSSNSEIVYEVVRAISSDSSIISARPKSRYLRAIAAGVAAGAAIAMILGENVFAVFLPSTARYLLILGLGVLFGVLMRSRK